MIEKARPPAWEPPKLLLVVVIGLHVVVGTSRVVVVVVDGGVWLLGSDIWLHQPKRKERGKRGSKATVSTHPKYSQARIYTTYATLSKDLALHYVDLYSSICCKMLEDA